MKVKKKAKRFFAILMSLAMVVSMMPTIAFAAPDDYTRTVTKIISYDDKTGTKVTATGDSSVYPGTGDNEIYVGEKVNITLLDWGTTPVQSNKYCYEVKGILDGVSIDKGFTDYGFGADCTIEGIAQLGDSFEIYAYPPNSPDPVTYTFNVEKAPITLTASSDTTIYVPDGAENVEIPVKVKSNIDAQVFLSVTKSGGSTVSSELKSVNANTDTVLYSPEVGPGTYTVQVTAKGTGIFRDTTVNSNNVTVSAGKTTTTTLKVEQGSTTINNNDDVDEGSVVKLTAEVKEGTNDVTKGTVTYYADGLAAGTVLAGDSFEYTMPMLNGAAKTVNFDAKYSGAGTYAASQTTAETTVNVNSIYIVNDGVAVTATPALKMNTESTLSLTGAVKNSAGDTLSSGDYSVEFYQNTGNGVWTKMTGATAKPLNNGYAYMARVLPAGTYTEGAFETAPIGGGDITMIDTAVAVVKVGSETIYQNKPVAYKATVTDGSNNVAGGTISFYYEKDGNSVFVNTVPVVEGKASYEISFPEATTDTSKYTVKAVYSGNNIYNSSNNSIAEQVVESTTISATPGLSASPGLAVGTESTLTLGGMDDYTLGTDYVVVWEQNDGTGWAEFDRTVSGIDMTKEVTPDSDKWSYRAVILPAGNYIAPENGLVAGPTATITTKIATTTELTAEPANAVEGQPLILTATVKEENSPYNPAVGIVVFYKGDSDVEANRIGEARLDSVGQASITITAPEYSTAGQQYYVKYLGNDTYAVSAGSLTDPYKSASSVLMTAADAVISITGETAADGSLIVGKEYTLETPAVTDEAGIAKTEGKDYKVIWQLSTNSGGTWTDFGSYSGTKIKVTPTANNTQFRAVIEPLGEYTAIKKGSEGTEESALVLEAKLSSVASTTTTLNVSPAFCKEGEKVTLNVTVKGNVNNEAVSGTVRVYRYVDGSTGDIAIGYKDLDSQGSAAFETEAPAFDKDTAVNNTHYYYAKYEGNSSYGPSGAASNNGANSYVDEVTVSSNKIITENTSVTISVDPNHPSLIVNNTYKLTIPDVFQQGADQGDGTNKLECGKDYNVQWQVSYDNGETWTALANEGDSIDVTPEKKNAQYKALITPYGAYKQAYDGTKTVEKLIMQTVTSIVVETTTTLAVKDTAADEEVSGITYKTEYEGETVTLAATVKETSTDTPLVESGYVYFYRDGVLLNTVPVEVKDGVATLVTPMTEYSSSNTQDNFTAKYAANDSYGASEDTTGVTVRIRSTKIDVPVIKTSKMGKVNGTAGDTTTKEYGIVGLPAGTPIDFSLTGTVTALDGRELKAGTDYTLQWEQNSNQGMFVEISGATATPYNLPKGENGDSFRLTLKPAGYMTAGNTSLTATIGTLADPEVTINVTTPYNEVQGSHYGDEVAISVRIEGASALPTGVASFWYDAFNDGKGEVQLGDYVTLQKSSNPSDTNVAVARITTTVLPQDQMRIYVKYHGDTMFKAEDTYNTNMDASAIKSYYRVWSTEIENTDIAKKLNISVTKKNGTAVTGDVTVLDAASTYELTLRTPIYTEDGQGLKAGEYEIVWQQSENGIDWVKVPGAENKTTCTVKPENDNMQYRAQITTTYDLFALPLVTVPTRLDTELSNVIGCNPQAVTVDVTTSMSNAAPPYTDSVYEGNEITLYAEVIPTDEKHTEVVGGKVEFYYAVAEYDENSHSTIYGALTAVPSSDPKDGGDNEAAVVERDGKYYAAITTKDLPAKADGKMQQVAIVAWYMGDGTYDEFKPAAATDSDTKVTVYSSTVYADNSVQNEVLPDTIAGGKPTKATAGIIIYAPENVLVSDGSATVLTLKNLYTLDAQDGSNPALVATPGEYTSLTENTNYTIQWQYTTALNTAKPANSSWIKLDAAGHQATVSPLAGYAYRAVITVDQSAERTVKSQKTYYSNILVADAADAVLQLRATPASSGGFKNTDLVFDAYVSGGTTVPVGNITLTLDGTLGGGVNRTATAVNGHVKFGGGIGDTAGKINLPADVYTMKASYEGNNGYKTELNEQTYIVRYKAEEVSVNITESAYENLVYDGTIQRPDKAAVSFNGGTGHTAAQNKADASVVFNYEMKKGDSWVAVDAPFDAGEYRVTAVLPESIYYEAQKSAPLTFSIAQREVEVDDILVQAKVYNGKTDANILDVELTGVVAGDSVYTTGAAVTGKADALKANTVTYTATGLVGPDASNYKFADGGNSKTEDFTIARNLVTVDSSAITGTGLVDLKVYDNYGTEMKKGTDYTVRYFYHDGSGVKETTNLNKEGKYTVIIAPKDTANYKGGESFVMNVAADVTFKGNDTAAPAKPGIISITGTQQLWNANAVTTTASNGSTASVAYNVTDVDKAGRYGVTATAAGCDETHGILTVYKAEAEHIVPVVDNKVFDGAAVTVKNTAAFTTPGTYFTYTGGEIIGISYDAPKDAGVYTVTAHVPATDTTVAYTETSTFEIAQKPITVSAVSVTKETFRTNPALRVTYDGLVEGDSDLKDMLVLPSFELKNTEGVNHDLNQVGDFTIVPSGIVSRNYKATYNNANFAVQHTDPALNMNIVGLPNGQTYYGDEFQVSLYGNVAERVDGNGIYNNPSSVVNYFVSDGAGWSKDNGNVTIDNDGNVKIKGAAAADFTIRAERGTGDYKIFTTIAVDVEKRPVYISMKGEDTKVYNGIQQNVDTACYSVTGYVSPDVINSSDCAYSYNPATHKDVDEYQISVNYEDAKYIGVGKGLMTITPKSAVVTSKDNLANIYGQTSDVADADYTVTGMAGTDTAADVITAAVTKSDVRFNSDVGGYEIFTAGVENKNYDVSYESGEYGVAAKALTTAAGVDDKTVINTITDQVKRAYGVVNPRMGYQVSGLIAGDSLADLLIDKNFVVYSRVQEDNANVVGSANTENVKAQSGEYVNGYKINDNYGLIDLHNSVANINLDACNYIITPADGLLDIYQSNVTIKVQGLTVKKGTTLDDSSYYAVVRRVLTEAPMNDTLADLRLHYTPHGTAGTGPCVTGTGNINVTLEQGSTDLDSAEYFAQNYYAAFVEKGDLTVKDMAAVAAIGADKNGATVKTTVQLAPVYNYDGTAYTKVEDSYVMYDQVTGTANEDGYNAVSGLTLYNGSVASGSTASEGSFVKSGEKVVKPVNVGDIDFIVIDKNGNQAAIGTMTADAAKVGEYTTAFSPALGNGKYTILLNPTGEYALQPTVKDFTVGGSDPVTPGGGGGGTVVPPTLIKDDHFAYMQGDGFGYFKPDSNLTRAEAATIFYNLLTDKSMGDMTTSFSDVSGSAWYATAVNTLASLGIIDGYKDGTFKPEANVTRAEFAAIASRFDDLSSGTASFTDVPSSHWAYSYIVSAATKGWITGYEDGTFKPEANIVRAEVVTLVNRVLERVPDKKFIDKNIDDIKVLKDVKKAHWAYYYMIEATNGHDYSKDSKGNETWERLK